MHKRDTASGRAAIALLAFGALVFWGLTWRFMTDSAFFIPDAVITPPLILGTIAVGMTAATLWVLTSSSR